MGVTDNEGNTGNRKKTQPPAQNGSRWADDVADAGGCGWDTVDCTLLKRVLVLATRQKMAVSFAATADNRGVSITILDGPDRPKYYCNSSAELERRLVWLTERLAPLAD